MIRCPDIITRLRSDERGVAAIEFALWSTILFVTLLGAADFGVWRAYQLRLNSAVEQASMLAMQSPSSFSASTLKTFIQTSASLPGTAPVVAIGCNISSESVTAATNNCANTSRTYYCLDGGTTPVAYTAATTTPGTNCTAPVNTTSGYYLTIKATYAFRPVVLPSRWLSNTSIIDAATVRLQ